MSEGRKSAFWFAVGTAVGAGIAYRIGKIFDRNDERPPIIVKGGSVVFTNHLVPGEHQSRAWVDDGSNQNWKPDQPNGKDVKELIVSVINPAGSCVAYLTGRQVLIMRSSGAPLHVVIAHGEPVIGPKDQLRERNNIPLKTLSDDSARLVAVRVNQEQCPLNQDSEVWIWPR